MAILLVDSYDSFTYNVRDLIRRASGEEVVTIHNDSITYQDLEKYLPLFTAVVIGPGPGNPHDKADVGLIPELFKGSVIPLLGICLGFQSMCLEHGSQVDQLKSIKHGQVYPITHNAQDPLFKGIANNYKSVRYHSLYVSQISDEFIPLAYTKDHDQEIIMAAKHTEKPWFGVQYHPESICSEFGEQLIENFMKSAHDYNQLCRIIEVNPTSLSQLSTRISIPPLIKQNPSAASSGFIYEKFETTRSILEICESIRHQGQEFILLNSASYPGSWSIVGLPTESSLHLTHSTESPSVIRLTEYGKETTEEIGSIWKWISAYMESHLIQDTETSFPFIGGFMGIFSYEEGEYISVTDLPKITNGEIPDTKLVFVKNCILRNNESNETYITSLENNLAFIKSLLSTPSSFTKPQSHIPTTKIVKPDETRYKDLFNQCQEYLHSGDSYELCLTNHTELQIPTKVTPWEIYKTLVVKNPSPYSAFFEFDDCILISSSPERFIHWDNQSCELRPIKGTVKNSSDMTRAKAEAILNTPKEMGENLMIVDLIRHDLYQVLDHVKVAKLMNIEEYSSVFQLVSIIRGVFDGEYSGIDILSRSLPPGSMTGAPKKRSVEILQKLEQGRRGLYSGVCGYWSVENKADWSVIIRSLFHYKDDVQNDKENNTWRIGAGGAITVLSDAIGEWEELLTKLNSALQVFEPTT